MLNKIVIFILIFLLTVSLTANFVLFKKQNVNISFEKSDSPSPTPSAFPTQIPVPTTEVVSNKVNIGKSINIPLTNPQGGSVNELQYTLESYEISDEIMLNGKTTSTVKGRKFLIIDINILNPLNQSVEIKSRDYIRLAVNNSGNWIAADIHNDPVEIQPISVKNTRIAFPINETDTDFSLQLGEISGQKEVIKL